MVHIDTMQASIMLEANRRLLLQKDVFELTQWMEAMEDMHTELNALSIIEKQLIKKNTLSVRIISIRRKNTLTLGAFCKYEQHIKTEVDYGKELYDLKRAKFHEKQRDLYKNVLNDFRSLKSDIHTYLVQLHIK